MHKIKQMYKGAKNITKASFKLKVMLTIESVAMSCSDTVYIKPQIKRGDQDIIDLETYTIPAQQMN